MRQRAGKVVTARQTGLFGKAMPEVKPPAVFDRVEAIRKQCWAEGKVAIRTLTGKSERQAGVIIGKLLKVARDDCALLLAAFREALDLRPAEPMPWLVKTVKMRADDRAAVERIAGDWNLIEHADLDANAARLMERDSPAPPPPPAAADSLALEFSARFGD